MSFPDKMKECRLAALNSSDDVVMTVDVRKFSYSEKWSHFYDIGLSTPMILALGVPAFLAMREQFSFLNVLQSVSQTSIKNGQPKKKNELAHWFSNSKVLMSTVWRMS